MCGIAGFIGQSKNHKITFKLITNLFRFSESRGADASGVWGLEAGQNGRVVYHKEPTRSSDFVQKEFWKNLRRIKLNMLLVHARAASKGPVHAFVNSNNHPFVSKDCRIGMVHNGQIDEAKFLQNKYQVGSDTDSEFLLRIYEYGLDKQPQLIQGITDEVSQRLTGIKDIWSVVSSGAMAVALGERLSDDSQCLFLFHNEKRPLWIVDLRKTLGQIFFFSSPDIWYKTINGNKELKEFCWGTQKLIEIPTQEIWYFKTDASEPMVGETNFHRFDFEVSNSVRDWEQGDFCPIKEAKVMLPLITEESTTPPGQSPKILPISNIINKNLWLANSVQQIPITNTDEVHAPVCCEIQRLLAAVDITATNMLKENSLSPEDHHMLMNSLSLVQHELEGTLQLLTN